MMPQKATAAAVSSATTTIDDDPQPLDVDAEVAGRALAERRAGRGAGPSSIDADDARRPRAAATTADVLPARAVEAAELPEDDLLAGLRVAEEREEGDAGAGKALTAMPVSTRVTTSVRPPARDIEVDEQRGDQAADEGADGDGPGRRAKVQPKTMTRAGAERLRRTETPTTPGSASGLPNTPCMSAPADGEGGADEHGHHDPREADWPEGGLAVAGG